MTRFLWIKSIRGMVANSFLWFPKVSWDFILSCNQRARQRSDVATTNLGCSRVTLLTRSFPNECNSVLIASCGNFFSTRRFYRNFRGEYDSETDSRILEFRNSRVPGGGTAFRRSISP